VDLEGLRAQSGDYNTIFLAYSDGTLAGFCTLDGMQEIELCGGVYPALRRQGIGRALLETARAECRRRSAVKLLLICEQLSRSGQGFVATLDAPLEFAEHRMDLDVAATGLPAVSHSLELRPATRGDQQAIAHISALGFERDEVSVLAHLVADMESPVERFFVALRDGIPMGTLKIFYAPPRALIYGFTVLPEYQGRGYGREILHQTIRLLSEEGWTHIGLEVETENLRAYNLYLSSGFQHLTTYGYYALPGSR
jgi:ribosomal protein S18 acetylase RimI-like enzyme